MDPRAKLNVSGLCQYRDNGEGLPKWAQATS